MSDNVVQTLQKLVQDVIAPDVRETKVRLESLAKETDTRFDSVQKQMDARFDAVDKQFLSLSREMEANFKSVLAAIAASKAQADLSNLTVILDLRERVAVLESKHN